MKFKVITLLLLFGALGFNLQAQSIYDKINKAQFVQQKMIDEGIRKGRITPREADRLWAEQDRIEHFEYQALRNGRLSHNEVRRLSEMQADAHYNIINESRDRSRVHQHRNNRNRCR